MTETATVETPEVVISDGSHLAEGVLTKLKNAAKRSVELIVKYPALQKATAEIFVGVASERALMRTFVLLDDNEPDWSGGSQTYKLEVNAREKEAFEHFSDEQKKSFDTNVRSHMRRTVLEPIIVKYSADKLGVPVASPSDSPTLAAEVRRQYDRCKLAIPDKWRETPPNGAGPGKDAIETPASKVNAASVALKEISAPERIGYLHKMATDAVTPLCEVNAVVPGGRKSAANAIADFRNFLSAAFFILDGQVSGQELEDARKKLEKHSYQD